MSNPGPIKDRSPVAGNDGANQGSVGPADLAAFDYSPRTAVIFGLNSVERCGELARSMGAKHVLLVTDPGIVAAGHAARVSNLLEQAGLKVTWFDRARENPSTACVQACVETAKAAGIDGIVGLGGGSSMDTAKGCNFILTNGGKMQDYWGVGKAKLPMLPLIAIPTTGGTGSECQSFALIADERTHQKMACGDPKAAARYAILDPALTVSQPPRVTACTGIDAVAHAVETAVTRKRNPISWMFSREAFRLTVAGLPRVLANPNDLDARGQMLLGAAWAGTAIENSMLGAAHSAANPLTALYGIVHGHAVGMMLPHIVRFNGQEPQAAAAYAELLASAGIEREHPGSKPGERLSALLQSFLDLAELPCSLRLAGAKKSDLSELAKQAAAQWTAQFNPRSVKADDFLQLYEAAWE